MNKAARLLHRQRLNKRGKLTSRRRLRNLQNTLTFESLESRLLLAADPLAGPLSLPEASDPPSYLSPSDLPQLGEAEGEDGADLVAFAQALTAANVKFYGAAWCPACEEQKDLFQDGARFLPFIEVTNPDHTLNSVGIAEGITGFPTWEFNGTKVDPPGVLSLAEISSLSGIAIPQSNQFVLAPIEDTTVLGGSPLNIALDGWDPAGDQITYTVSSSNPSLVSGTIFTGRSMDINTSGFGTLSYHLFDTLVPRVTGAITDLATNNTLDNTNVHRIADLTGTGGTIIQGGASVAPQFDDQFHPDLQHNSFGIASYAKSNDDTNAGQIFLLGGGPTRHLDGNHSIFAFLTEGQKILEEIARIPTTGTTPDFTLTIEDVTVYDNKEDGVLMLKAAEGASGEADITVTATDEDGNVITEVFHVMVTPDTVDTLPFLNDVPPLVTQSDGSLTAELTAVDVEGDPIQFNVFPTTNVTVQLTSSPVTPNGQTATTTLTVIPNQGFVGTETITIFVHDPSTAIDPSLPSITPAAISSVADVQQIVVTVGADAPTAINLLDSSDTGISDVDNTTNLNQIELQVDGVTDGALVRVFADGNAVGSAVASGTSVVITTSALADGVHALTATQTINNVESGATAELEVTIDTVIGSFSTTPTTTAELGVAYSYDPLVSEEGETGFTYELLSAPNGASVNPANGRIGWSPIASQVGNQDFVLRAMDLAGNTVDQSFTVAVTGDVLARYRFETVDSNGSPISSASVGETVTLNVFIQDPRAFDARGVFAAFLDVVLENRLLSVAGDPEFSSTYSVSRSFDLSTAGEIDEVGGASGSLTEIGGDEFLLFSIDLQADIAGTETISGNPADAPTIHDMLVYGSNDPVPTGQVDYGSLEFTVTLGFGANGDIFNFDEDTQNNFLDVLANDASQTGGQLTVVNVSAGDKGGTISIAANGSGVTYTPAADFNGEETFTYDVEDSNSNGISTATVVVQVQPANDPPTANDDTFSANEDSIDNFFDVIANDDSAPDVGETLRVTGVGTTTNGGTVRIGPGGTHILYSAPANATGTDSFTYTISDGNGGTASATVNVTLQEGNDNPVANPDTFTVAEDSAATTLDVLANDTTGPDTGETLTIIGITGISDGGTVTIASDNLTVDYTPAADFSGFESFTYQISDGNGGTAVALVTVEVTNSNDAPVAVDDQLTAVRDVADQPLIVLGNDSDPDPDAQSLTVESFSQGSDGGTLTLASDGVTLFYTPATGFVGDETFTYTASDGTLTSNEATVTVTVQEFGPSEISGFVYIDANMNGLRESVELPVAGVTVNLSGTDAQGTAVQQTQVTGANGRYVFANLAPGDYEITQVQPAFLADGIDAVGTQGGSGGNDRISFTLASGTAGVVGAENNFGENGRQTQFISLVDWFASTTDTGILAAVDQQTGTLWYSSNNGWSGFSNVELANGGNAFNVTAQDANGIQQSLSLPTNNGVLQVIGNSGNSQLVRVLGSHSTFGLNDPTSPPAADDTSGDDTSGDNTGGDNTGGDNTGGGAGEGSGNNSGAGGAEGEGSRVTPVALPQFVAGSLNLQTGSPLETSAFSSTTSLTSLPALPAPSTQAPALQADALFGDATDRLGDGTDADPESNQGDDDEADPMDPEGEMEMQETSALRRTDIELSYLEEDETDAFRSAVDLLMAELEEATA